MARSALPSPNTWCASSETTKSSDTGLVVLRMDTPGGLDTSMREIIRAILASPVPVATYVAPSGARAASAGTYITYASAIAAMAPGTNLGAATPIQLGLPLLPGGQPEQPAGEKGHQGNEGAGRTRLAARPPRNRKTPNPERSSTTRWRTYAALPNSTAATRTGRPTRCASAVSLPASEALKLHVIDVIADDVPDLLRKIDGRTVIVAGKPERLATAGLEVVTVAPDWRTRLLAVITNPNVAYLLMLLGAYGLIFELANPGAVLPGLIGGISLLVALFALNLLPIDYAGAGLVLLGIALMVAEAFIGSFGVIGAGGIVAFAIGSIVMFHSNAPGIGLSLSLVAAVHHRDRRFSHSGARHAPALPAAPRASPAAKPCSAPRARRWSGTARKGESGSKARFGALVLPVPCSPGSRIKVVSRRDLILTVEPI